MSYILESLKKSDKNRQDTTASAKQALRGAPQFGDEPEEHTVSFALLLAVFLALLAGGFGIGWYYSGGNISTPVDEFHSVTETPIIDNKPLAEEPLLEQLAQPVALEPEKSEPSVIAVEENLQESEAQVLYQRLEQQQQTPEVTALYDAPQETAPIRQAINTEQSNDTESTAIVSVYDLSDAQRRRIPAISYGAHIYASDQRSGFVILNGTKRNVGDQLPNGLYIERVEEDSVVLSFQGLVFFLPAMQSWNQ